MVLTSSHEQWSAPPERLCPRPLQARLWRAYPSQSPSTVNSFLDNPTPDERALATARPRSRRAQADFVIARGVSWDLCLTGRSGCAAHEFYRQQPDRQTTHNSEGVSGTLKQREHARLKP